MPYRTDIGVIFDVSRPDLETVHKSSDGYPAVERRHWPV